ncbi:prenyltransferase [Bacillaceae bacterium W0354]
MQYATKQSTTGERQYLFRRSWFQIARPMTFAASLGPMTVAFLLANQSNTIRIDLLIIFLITGLLIQSTVNMLNDYFDFKKGQDVNRWALAERRPWKYPTFNQIPLISIMLTSIASLLTIYLANESNPKIILLGIIGLILGVYYSATRYSFSAIAMGEVAGAVCLGFLPVIIAYIIQGAPITKETIFVALPFAFLMTTMVLSNNIRDIEKDEGYRITVAMILRRKKSARLLLILTTIVYLTVVFLIYKQLVPVTSILVFLASPVAVKLLRLYFSYKKEDAVLGMNWAAYHHWLFSSLFIISLLIT